MPGAEGCACLQPGHCAGGSGLPLLSHGASRTEGRGGTLRGGTGPYLGGMGPYGGGPGPYGAPHAAGTGGCELDTAGLGGVLKPPLQYGGPQQPRNPQEPPGTPPPRSGATSTGRTWKGKGDPTEGDVASGGVCGSWPGGSRARRGSHRYGGGVSPRGGGSLPKGGSPAGRLNPGGGRSWGGGHCRGGFSPGLLSPREEFLSLGGRSARRVAPYGWGGLTQSSVTQRGGSLPGGPSGAPPPTCRRRTAGPYGGPRRCPRAATTR